MASEQKRWAFNFPGKCDNRVRVHVLLEWSPGEFLGGPLSGLSTCTAGVGLPGSTLIEELNSKL